MTSPAISTSKLQQTVDALLPRVVEIREDLHRHPELSWQERRTSAQITQILKSGGFSAVSTPLETGVVAELVSDPAAPFVMLRADIDALPIQDAKETPYRSQNPGVCHACAHDAHTATMLGVALAARQLELSLPYNLRFVFQPAEEPIPSGAPKMIEKGVLEGVCCALGLHMEPRLALGTIGLADGWINMQSIRLDLALSGPGGHSARPHETADLLWIASRIIQDGYQMAYRELNHLDTTVVLTFTEIEARKGYNVIPNELRLTGTLRLSDPAKKAVFFQRFQPYLAYLEQETSARIELSIQEGAPAVFNDPALMARLRDNLAADFWIPVEVDSEFRTPGGDDFSYYSREVPGAMVRIGVGTGQTRGGLHDGRFDLPAEALRIAVAFFLRQLTTLQI